MTKIERMALIGAGLVALSVAPSSAAALPMQYYRLMDAGCTSI